MSAALTDKLRKGAPLFRTTLAGTMSDSDTTFSLQTATLLPTDTAVDFIIDQVDTNGEVQDASLMEVITGTVSGTTVTTDATRRGLSGTDARAHNVGAVVDVVLTADSWNDLIDTILVSHEQDGTLKDNSVDAPQLKDNAVTRGKLGAGALPIVYIPLVASSYTPTGSYVTYDPSKCTIDFSKLVTGASAAYLRATANNGTGSQTMNIQLLNVTDAAVITSSQLSVTTTGAAEVVTGNILANLPTASKLMAYQVKVTSGAVAIHRIVLEIHY